MYQLAPTLPVCHLWYGVAADSRIDKITGLFFRIMSLLQGSFTKETYNLIVPTNQRHPIAARFKIEQTDAFHSFQGVPRPP